MSRSRHISLLSLFSLMSSMVWAQSFLKPASNNSVECNRIAEWLKRARSSVVSIQLYVSEEKEGLCRVGSGFVYKQGGWIVTRSSIVQSSDSIVVTFSDGRDGQASVVLCDEMTEIALLKVPFSDLISVFIGETSTLDRQSQLIVLGNSLGIFPSVTLGTYEGVRLDGMLQLRITVPAGNSGSPVFDHDGRIVGMLAGRVLEEKDQEVEPGRLGVALPIERVTEIVDEVLQQVEKGKGWLGLTVNDLEGTETDKGVKVVGLVPGGPAEKAEICIGDTIVGFEGESVPNARELAKWIREIPMSHEVVFTIRKRDGNISRFVEVGGIP